MPRRVKKGLPNPHRAALARKEAEEHRLRQKHRFLWIVIAGLDVSVIAYSIDHYWRSGHVHVVVHLVIMMAITVLMLIYVPLSKI